jgi:hypothetical protein
MEEMMYRNILVPLDGSSFAELAIPTAAALANAMGACRRFCDLQWRSDARDVCEEKMSLTAEGHGV